MGTAKGTPATTAHYAGYNNGIAVEDNYNYTKLDYDNYMANLNNNSTVTDLNQMGWATDKWGRNDSMNKKRDTWGNSGAVKIQNDKGEDMDASSVKAALNFLRSKGYSITADGWWGQQSQAAYNDWKNRQAALASTQNVKWDEKKPELTNPVERSYTVNEKNEHVQKPFYNVTSDDLKLAGITNYQGYLNYMAKHKDDQNDKIAQAFYRVQTQANRNPDYQINLDTEEGFNKAFGTSGRYGKMDRNKILHTMNDYLQKWDALKDTPTAAGNYYTTFTNALKDDPRFKDTYDEKKLQWRTGGNGLPTVYYVDNNNYYKLGDDNKVSQVGWGRGNDGTYALLWRHGGRINKFQQGGSMGDQQQLQLAFLQFLAQQTGAKSQEELEQVIQQMGEDGLKQAYAQFIQMVQQQLQLSQVQAARFGAKLAYINRLNNRCPYGTYSYYYKEGGRLCKKCVSLQRGGEIEEETHGNAVEQFKAAVGRNKKKYGKKYDKDLLAGRKPVGKDSKGRDLYLDGDGNARPVSNK